MMRTALYGLVALPLALAPISAQETVEAPVEITPMETLATALDDAGKRGVTLRGEIVDRSKNAGGAGNGAMVVVGGMGAKKKALLGPVEAHARGQQVFVCTQKALPGACAMRNGREVLVQTTGRAKDPIDASTLSTDIVHLLDFKRLSKEVARAEQRALDGKKKRYKVTSSEEGAHTIRLAIRPSILPDNDDGNPVAAMMKPKILGVEAQFELDAEGALRGMRLTVTRSDPMAAIRKRAMQSGGNFELADASAFDDEDPEEGAKTEYAFEVQKEQMSERARASQKRMSALFER